MNHPWSASAKLSDLCQPKVRYDDVNYLIKKPVVGAPYAVGNLCAHAAGVRGTWCIHMRMQRIISLICDKNLRDTYRHMCGNGDKFESYANVNLS